MTPHEHRIRMANQIARNFAAMDEMNAVAATADHIDSFWDRRMKAALLADPSGLLPAAAAAVERLRRGGPVPHQTPATEFAQVDEVGRSDAG